MTNQEYPSDWDKVDQNQSSSSEFLKIKSGEKVRIRIIAGPMGFQQLYLETGEQRRGLNLPFGAQLPGYKPRAQYAFEVLILDGGNAGTHKVLTAGQKMAEQLRDIRKEWGSLDRCDVIISKTGTGLETKWSAVPVPATKQTAESLAPVFDLTTKIVMATKEQIEALPPAPVGQKKVGDSLDKPISKKQADYINELAGKKELTLDYVLSTVERKFAKKELDELTSAEASQLIDTLKAA